MSDETHSLAVTTKEVRGTPVVEIRGEVDLHTAPQLRDQLLDSARRVKGRLYLDLSNVPYMDSSGVGTLVYVKREVERSGGRMVLCALQPRVRSVLEITHLQKFFQLADSVDEVVNE